MVVQPTTRGPHAILEAIYILSLIHKRLIIKHCHGNIRKNSLYDYKILIFYTIRRSYT
jgi:hypothetical protein